MNNVCTVSCLHMVEAREVHVNNQINHYIFLSGYFDGSDLFICMLGMAFAASTAESPRFIILSSISTFSNSKLELALAELTNLSAVFRALQSYIRQKYSVWLQY